MRKVNPPRRGQSGQATILGVVTLLLLSLSLFTTYNMGQAAHERIRIQQHADAQAFAIATEVARTYNYWAVTNRAIASGYVSLMALHAYMSELTAVADQYWVSFLMMLEVEGQEDARCADWDIECCWHAIEALFYALDFLFSMSDQNDVIEGLDGKFRTACQAFVLMINEIHASQLDMAELMVGFPGYLRTGVTELKNINAPNSTDIPFLVGALNIYNFQKTVDMNQPRQRKVMTEAANGSRSDWVKMRPPTAAMVTLLPLWEERLPDVASDCSWIAVEPPLWQGSALSDSSGVFNFGNGPDHGIEGKGIDSADWGVETMFCWESVAFASYPFIAPIWQGEVYSDKNGGEHNGGLFYDGHDGGKHDFSGVNSGGDWFGCILSGQCYMKFDVKNDPQADWGQPSFYSYITQDLRLNLKGQRAGKGSFEIKDTEVSVGLGAAGTAKLNIHDDKVGRAAGKAMTYYHRFHRSGTDGWKEQPNFFNPYWRAKLQPFRVTDYLEVMGAAMDVEGAEAGGGILHNFINVGAGL